MGVIIKILGEIYEKDNCLFDAFSRVIYGMCV